MRQFFRNMRTGIIEVIRDRLPLPAQNALLNVNRTVTFITGIGSGLGVLTGLVTYLVNNVDAFAQVRHSPLVVWLSQFYQGHSEQVVISGIVLVLVFLGLWLVSRFFAEALEGYAQLDKRLTEYLHQVESRYATVRLPVSISGRQLEIAPIEPQLERQSLINGLIQSASQLGIGQLRARSGDQAQRFEAQASRVTDFLAAQRPHAHDTDFYQHLTDSRRRMAILGDDDSGKTALLLRKASEIARAHGATTALPARYSNRIPIYVSLAEFQSSGMSVSAYLDKTAQDLELTSSDYQRGALAEALSKYGEDTILFLDDLDVYEPAKQLAVVAAFVAPDDSNGNPVRTIARFPGYIIVSYHNTDASADAFKHAPFFTAWKIQPLTAATQNTHAADLFREYLQQQSAAEDDQDRAASMAPSPKMQLRIKQRVDRETQTFIAALASHPQRDNLIANPFYFTLATYAHFAAHHIPLSRAQLYKMVIDETLRSHVTDPLWRAVVAREASKLAHYLYTQSLEGVDSAELFDYFSQSGMSPTDAVRLAQELRNSLVLERRDDRYRFHHPSFQRYFAALDYLSAPVTSDDPPYPFARNWMEVDALMQGIALLNAVPPPQLSAYPPPLALELELDRLLESDAPLLNRTVNTTDATKVTNEWIAQFNAATGRGDFAQLAALLQMVDDIAELPLAPEQTDMLDTLEGQLRGEDIRQSLEAELALLSLGRHKPEWRRPVGAIFSDIIEDTDQHWALRAVALCLYSVPNEEGGATRAALQGVIADSHNIVLRVVAATMLLTQLRIQAAATAPDNADKPSMLNPFVTALRLDTMTGPQKDTILHAVGQIISDDTLSDGVIQNIVDFIEAGEWSPWVEPLLVASTLLATHGHSLFDEVRGEASEWVRASALLVMAAVNWLKTGGQDHEHQYDRALKDALADDSGLVQLLAFVLLRLKGDHVTPLPHVNRGANGADLSAWADQIALWCNSLDDPAQASQVARAENMAQRSSTDFKPWLALSARTRDLTRQLGRAFGAMLTIASAFAPATDSAASRRTRASASAGGQPTPMGIISQHDIARYRRILHSAVRGTFVVCRPAFIGFTRHDDRSDYTTEARSIATWVDEQLNDQGFTNPFAKTIFAGTWIERLFWRLRGWWAKLQLRIGARFARRSTARAACIAGLGLVIGIESYTRHESAGSRSDKRLILRRFNDADVTVQTTAIAAVITLNLLMLFSGHSSQEKLRRMRVRALVDFAGKIRPATAPALPPVLASLGAAAVVFASPWIAEAQDNAVWEKLPQILQEFRERNTETLHLRGGQPMRAFAWATRLFRRPSMHDLAMESDRDIERDLHLGIARALDLMGLPGELQRQIPDAALIAVQRSQQPWLWLSTLLLYSTRPKGWDDPGAVALIKRLREPGYFAQQGALLLLARGLQQDFLFAFARALFSLPEVTADHQRFYEQLITPKSIRRDYVALGYGLLHREAFKAQGKSLQELEGQDRTLLRNYDALVQAHAVSAPTPAFASARAAIAKAPLSERAERYESVITELIRLLGLPATAPSVNDDNTPNAYARLLVEEVKSDDVWVSLLASLISPPQSDIIQVLAAGFGPAKFAAILRLPLADQPDAPTPQESVPQPPATAMAASQALKTPLIIFASMMQYVVKGATESDPWVRWAILTRLLMLINSANDAQSAEQTTELTEAEKNAANELLIAMIASPSSFWEWLAEFTALQSIIQNSPVATYTQQFRWYERLAYNLVSWGDDDTVDLVTFAQSDDLGVRFLATHLLLGSDTDVAAMDVATIKQRMEKDDFQPVRAQMTSFELAIVPFLLRNETAKVIAVFALGGVQAVKNWAQATLVASDDAMAANARLRLIANVIQSALSVIPDAPTQAATGALTPAEATSEPRDPLVTAAEVLGDSLGDLLKFLIPYLFIPLVGVNDQQNMAQHASEWLPILTTEATAAAPTEAQGEQHATAAWPSDPTWTPEMRALLYAICAVRQGACSDDVIKRLQAAWLGESSLVQAAQQEESNRVFQAELEQFIKQMAATGNGDDAQPTPPDDASSGTAVATSEPASSPTPEAATNTLDQLTSTQTAAANALSRILRVRSEG